MSSTTITFNPTFTTPTRPLTWLITGCSSGLGLALARAVHASSSTNGQSHILIATSRDPSRTPDLVAELTSSTSSLSSSSSSSNNNNNNNKNRNKWLPLDVDHPTAAATLIEDLESNHGIEIDVLVNNAGWSIHQAAEHLTDEEVRAQFETVFFGPYRLARAVLPGMRRRRFGVVVNVSSGAGLEGRESMAAYAAAKAAMDGVIKVMAKEVAPFNIRTLTVLLGGFRTGMTSKVRVGAVPLADDYQDSTTARFLQHIQGGRGRLPVGDGDPAKAAQVIYDVVMGEREGVGQGRESELFLPLGIEMEARVKLVRDRLDHCWDVFGHVATNVRYSELEAPDTA